MRHIIRYKSLESEYELVVEQDDRAPIPPGNIGELRDGKIYEYNRGITHDDLIAFTHHYACEIVSWDSDPGN